MTPSIERRGHRTHLDDAATDPLPHELGRGPDDGTRRGADDEDGDPAGGGPGEQRDRLGDEPVECKPKRARGESRGRPHERLFAHAGHAPGHHRVDAIFGVAAASRCATSRALGDRRRSSPSAVTPCARASASSAGARGLGDQPCARAPRTSASPTSWVHRVPSPSVATAAWPMPTCSRTALDARERLLARDQARDRVASTSSSGEPLEVGDVLGRARGPAACADAAPRAGCRGCADDRRSPGRRRPRTGTRRGWPRTSAGACPWWTSGRRGRRRFPP